MEDYIKVVGYREYVDPKDGKEKTKQIYFEEPFNFPSHQDLFNNLDTLFATNIPKAERYNLHYTLNHMPKGAKSKTEVSYIEVIPLDIDHINHEYLDDYILIVEEVFKINRDSFATIATGNGLQFLFLLDIKYEEKDWLRLSESYGLLCDEIDKRIFDRVIQLDDTTGCDRGVFRIGTMRLPNTLNIKKEGTKKCELLTKTLVPFNIETLGLYFSKERDKKTLSTSPEKKEYYASTQYKYALKECAALKEFKEKKGKVGYGAWFACVSVISRFTDTNGEKLAHKLSSGHENYDKDETQRLIESTKGPSTCESFSKFFPQCKECKYFKTKVRSPINLRDNSFLSQEHTGFHRKADNRWVPVYRQIIEKFKQTYTHVSLATSEDMYIYSEKENFWRLLPRRELKKILKEMMSTKPGDYPSNTTYTNAHDYLTLENVMQDDFFYGASSSKINFINGHVEIKGTEKKFVPKTRDSLQNYFLFALPYAYDTEAVCPNFDKFIIDICGGDEKKAMGLMEFMGYVISNDEYWAHKFLMLEGDGSNGKSVLLELIRHLCGEGNFSSLKIDDLSNEQQRFNLVGKIANICDELDQNTLVKSAEVKNLTAGGRFTFKQVYSKPGEAINKAKFIFSINGTFTSTDSTLGMKRRYFPIELTTRFVLKNEKTTPFDRVADPHITKKLLKELPGIWNKCIDLYLKAKKQGYFTSNKSTEAQIADFERSSNHLKTYLMDTMGELEDPIYFNDADAKKAFENASSLEELGGLEFKDFTKIPVEKIRLDYNQWLDDNGYKGKYSAAGFGRAFKSQLRRMIRTEEFIYRRAWADGKKQTVFVCKWKPYVSDI